MTRFTLPIALLLSTTSTLALAAPAPDEATAQKLAGELQSALEARIPPELTAAGFTLTYGGPAKVTVDGDGYLVEMPTIHGTLPGDKQGSFDMGSITGRLTPTDTDAYAFSMTLPTPLATFGNQDSLITAKLVAQEITGVWKPGSPVLPELHATLGGISLTDAAEATLASLRETKLDSVYTPTAENRVNAEMSGYMAGLSIFDTDSRDKIVSLARAEGTAHSANVDLKAIEDIQAAMQNMASNPPTDTPEGGLAFVNSMAENLKNVLSFGAGDAKSTLTDLVITDASGTGAPTVWKLPTASFGATTGMNDDQTHRITFSYAHDRLSVTPTPEDGLGDLLPIKVGFDIDLDKLPLIQLLVAFQSTENEHPSTDGKGTAPDLSTRLQAKIDAVIAQYKPTLSITKILYGAPGIQSLTTGQFVADPAATHYATGTMDTRINNLDAFVAKLGQLAAPPKAADGQPQPQVSPNLSGVLMAATMLQGFGQQAEGGVRTYHLELNADGSAKVNGTDFGALLGMGAGAPPAEAPAEAPAAPPPSQGGPRKGH